jgi:hypothetical protein
VRREQARCAVGVLESTAGGGGELAPERGALLVTFADPRLERRHLVPERPNLGGVEHVARLALDECRVLARAEPHLEISAALLQLANPFRRLLERAAQVLHLVACLARRALVLEVRVDARGEIAGRKPELGARLLDLVEQL